MCRAARHSWEEEPSPRSLPPPSFSPKGTLHVNYGAFSIFDQITNIMKILFTNARKKLESSVGPAMPCVMRKSTTACQVAVSSPSHQSVEPSIAFEQQTQYMEMEGRKMPSSHQDHIRRKRIPFDAPLRIGPHSCANATSDEDTKRSRNGRKNLGTQKETVSLEVRPRQMLLAKVKSKRHPYTSRFE